MKQIIALLLVTVSFGVNAETLSCKYVSSKSELTNGFLTTTTAIFNCNGKNTNFIGDNIYVSCKPQFVLASFTKKLAMGEFVKFNVSQNQTSGIDGSRTEVTMVNQAISASGKTLKPQTIINHGKSVLCDPTQIVVN